MSGLDAGRVVPLVRDSLVVGRGPDADLQIEDPAVSRVHARFTRASDGTCLVHDLGSANGTYVGTKRVAAASKLLREEHVRLGPQFLLRFALSEAVDETLQMQLYESSTLDPLTRCYNRRYLANRLSSEVSHARRHSNPLSVLMLDVDHFKGFNDEFGHLAGDRVLCFVAAEITRVIRTEDLLARYGGDEFVVVARLTDHVEATRLAKRLSRAVGELSFAAAGKSLSVTVSIGVGSLTEIDPADDSATLLGLADSRLFGAKLSGRNCVCAD